MVILPVKSIIYIEAPHSITMRTIANSIPERIRKRHRRRQKKESVLCLPSGKERRIHNHHECPIRKTKRKRQCPPSLSVLSICLILTVSVRRQPAVHAQPPLPQSTCDFQNDAACDWRFDKECDALTLPQCENGDCFDCDLCLGLSYDCGSCVAAGCYWCPGDAICQSEPRGAQFWALNPEVSTGCPASSDWQQNCEAASPGNVFTDPLYDAMKWSFDMINVEEVWRQGITGAGIHVRVNDDGVDANHPEFAAQFDVDNSCEIYLPTDFVADTHGTGCASIIGAMQNNGECSVGIAPDVTISACITPPALDGAAEIFMTHLEVVDVISNSWGPLPCTNIREARQQQQQQDSIKQMTCPFSPDHPESPCVLCGATFDQLLTEACEKAITDYCSGNYELDPIACGEYLDLYVSCQFHSLSITNEEGFSKVVQEGRGGKGVIITFAGGNDYNKGVDANSDGMVNSRYTIGVGAVGKDGLHASYSTTGAAIFVAAPGGDEESISNNIVALPGGGCHDITVGTSFATPVVSAVAALILQANPELGWRDVQGIIAQTSQKNDFADSSWVINGSGMSHSYKYGFGVIDAAAAVAASKTWQNWETEKQIMVESGAIDVVIPDSAENSAGALAVLTITEEDVLTSTGENGIVMEAVVVYLEIAHASRGDLQIVLTSPQDTSSILAPSKRPENSRPGFLGWKLMTLRSWGESPVGSWTLEIADEKAGVINECIHLLWEFQSPDGLYFTCADFDEIPDCRDPAQVDPVLQQADFNGATILDACCGCGGGKNAADIQQQLQSWRLITYGHNVVPTNPPTATPTALTTPIPTVSGVNPQTLVPSSSSTVNPPAGLPPVDSATCNYREETCPFESLFDQECNTSCVDCFDCDPCQVHSATSCTTCVQNGCVWCPGDAICLSVALDAQYWATYEGRKTSSCPTASDWTSTCEKAVPNLFEDPLYDSMAWSYQLINVEPIWREGITGAGVHVRVNDDGVDGNHPEFGAKFDVQNSCPDYLPSDFETDFHGTACASIIAGSNNNECAVGIAPGAVISACKFPENNDPQEAQMFLVSLEAVDISSNSYGPDTCKYTKGRERNLQLQQQTQCPFPQDHSLSPCAVCGAFWGPNLLPDDCLTAVAKYCNLHFEQSQPSCIEYMDFFVSCTYHILPPVMHDAWVRTITEGRNGKGVIYLVAAGNLYSSRENTNANGYLNSRFTMAIAAVGKDGKHASYSSTGSSVFISAPGGDRESVSNNLVAKPGGGCHDITIGTSFATPVVSGVVALMLEVNPNLGYRDVQGVLASSAQQIDLTDDSWTSNSVGIRHSLKYGFGLVDASAAVTASRTWKRWGREIQILGESGPVNTEIPDDELRQFQSTMSIEDSRNLTTESVVVFMDLTHGSRGDLMISLTTPGGAQSILSPGNRPLNWQLEEEERWKFLTYSAWGAPPQGEWTLTIIDQSPGLIRDCRDYDWELERDGETYLCESFDGATDCTDPNQVADQSLLFATFEDRTALDACCVCGGGLDLTTVPNVLKSWRLLVYTHDNDEVVAPPSTPSPSGGGTSSPGATTSPNTTTPPGVPTPSGPPTTLAPVPLSEAIVMTISPNVTNLPFITSGSRESHSSWTRVGVTTSFLSMICLVQLLG